MMCSSSYSADRKLIGWASPAVCYSSSPLVVGGDACDSNYPQKPRDRVRVALHGFYSVNVVQLRVMTKSATGRGLTTDKSRAAA